MQNLIRLILKYGNFWSFVLLEVIAFYFVIQFNQRQSQIFLSSANRFSGTVNEYFDDITDYLSLKRQIDSLQRKRIEQYEEIKHLQNELKSNNNPKLEFIPDDTMFSYIPAGIISKSILGRNNTFTIDRGRRDSVQQDLGVIGNGLVVGMVRNVSDRYAVVMSNFHSNTKISAAVRGRGVHGSLVWEGKDTRNMSKKNIAKHAAVKVRDTVITSGYSYKFPRGFELGYVEEVRVPPGNNYYDIKVRLKEGFYKLDYVFVVDNTKKKRELEKLQETTNE